MAYLNNKEIEKEYNNGNIVIFPFNKIYIQPNSVDITLGENYFSESNSVLYNIWSKKSIKEHWIKRVALKRDDAIKDFYINNSECSEFIFEEFTDNIKEDDSIIILKPGERILGHTTEFIGANKHFTTKLNARSSMGRSGVSICLCAGLGDIGYTNRWTLEITNHSKNSIIPLIIGRRVGQIVFCRVNDTDALYTDRGKYQKEKTLDELVKNWKPEDLLPKLHLDKY